jgi:hypothetical protein
MSDAGTPCDDELQRCVMPVCVRRKSDVDADNPDEVHCGELVSWRTRYVSLFRTISLTLIVDIL